MNLIDQAIQRGATYLHLAVGVVPYARILDGLYPLNDAPLDAVTIQTLLKELMVDSDAGVHPDHFDSLVPDETSLTTCFDKTINAKCKLRVHVYSHPNGLALVIKLIRTTIPTLDQLEFPAAIKKIIDERETGLLLLSGLKNHGSSTTLAAVTEYINQTQARHIISFHNKIGHEHTNKKSIVGQYELPTDLSALKSDCQEVSNSNVDVVIFDGLSSRDFVDQDLISMAQHSLVIHVSHNLSASRCLFGLFEYLDGTAKYDEVRVLLSRTLRACVHQVLVPTTDQKARVVYEVLVGTWPVRCMLAENKTASFISTMFLDKKDGMNTLDQHLKVLFEQGVITRETGLKFVIDKGFFLRGDG